MLSQFEAQGDEIEKAQNEEFEKEKEGPQEDNRATTIEASDYGMLSNHKFSTIDAYSTMSYATPLLNRRRGSRSTNNVILKL